MPMFSADTLDFLFLVANMNRYFPRRENNAFFSGNLNTGTDLPIKFDLVKCITKSKYT